MADRIISVYYDGSYFTFKWLKALLWARPNFRKRGVDISFVTAKQYLPIKANRRSPKNFLRGRKFDILFVAHHHSHSFGLGGLAADQLLPVLKELREDSNMLVWLDTADSSGTCKFEVMPYVDLYLKKQILRDLRRYSEPLWGGRIFCDYYHRTRGLDDPELSKSEYETLDDKYVGKLKISWNLGLSDIFASGKLAAYFRPNEFTAPQSIIPNDLRHLDVHFRGSAWPSVVGWQRSRAKEILQNRHDLIYPDIDAKVKYRDYIAEIQHSRSVVSPFGWGELCFRDFEAMALGSTLLKPTLDHLQTFPDWFHSNKTYVPIDWDFEDLDKVLDNITERRDEYAEIASNAHSQYLDFAMSRGGREKFAQHVLQVLGINR